MYSPKNEAPTRTQRGARPNSASAMRQMLGSSFGRR
jgi:hypothetical protein